MSDRVWAVIVAAGRGARFGGSKQLAPLAGRSVLDHSVATARAACDRVVCVLGAELVSNVSLPDDVVVVEGGPTRSASVRAGLRALPDDAGVVLVHDAARPLATSELYERVIDAVGAGADAVVPVVPVVDTIRLVTGGVVDRDQLRAVQTPQGFPVDVLRAAHRSGAEASDDASLVEAAGGMVVLVNGETRNLKITTTADLAIAEVLVGQ